MMGQAVQSWNESPGSRGSAKTAADGISMDVTKKIEIRGNKFLLPRMI